MKKKILYVTRLDPYSLKSWSGVTYYILKYISKYYEVITVGPLSNRIRIFYIVKRFVFSLLKIKFDIDRPISVLKDFAKQIENKTKSIDYDAILTSEASLMTFLNSNSQTQFLGRQTLCVSISSPSTEVCGRMHRWSPPSHGIGSSKNSKNAGLIS